MSKEDRQGLIIIASLFLLALILGIVIKGVSAVFLGILAIVLTVVLRLLFMFVKDKWR